MEIFIPGNSLAQEKKDFEMLTEFSRSYPKKFYNMTPTGEGCVYDVDNTSADGKKYILELKGRNKNADHFPDCFIELNKFINLKRKHNNLPGNPIPLYINFIGDDADTIYIWDLTKPMECKCYLNIKIKEHTELQDRIGLKWTDAVKFSKQPDGKYKRIKTN